MMSLIEYFWTNLGTNIILTILAFVIALIFVLTMERYFNITIKNPINVKINNRNPVGKIPRMKNPMRRN